MVGIKSKKTSLSDNSRRDHIACPSGGVEQAKAVILAASLPKKTLGLPVLGSSVRAEVKPSFTNCRRMRWMVERLTPRMADISFSDITPLGRFSSESNRTLARVSCRALLLPRRVRFISSFRCFSESWILFSIHHYLLTFFKKIIT